ITVVEAPIFEEETDRRCLAVLAKDFSKLLLRLANKLVEQFRALDADEVRLALVRRRLRQERLPRSRRTVQQKPLWGNGVHLGKEFRIFQRPLYSLSKLLLNPLQPANIPPLDIRNLHQDFPHRRRFHLLQRFLEVGHSDDDLVENFHRDVLRFQVDLGKNSTKRTDSRLLSQRLEVRAYKPVGNISQLLQVHIFCQGHSPRVNLQNLQSTIPIWDTDLDLSIKPSGTSESRVYRVDPVRRAYDNYFAPRLQTVHH